MSLPNHMHPPAFKNDAACLDNVYYVYLNMPIYCDESKRFDHYKFVFGIWEGGGIEGVQLFPPMRKEQH